MTSIEDFVSQNFDVIIVHVTDTYFIESTTINGQVDLPGFSRIHSFLDAIRNNSYAAKQVPVIVLHGGDFLFPSLMSNYFKGKQIVEILNQCGFDYCTLGNHEFDGGIEILKKRLSDAQFGVIATNLQNQNNEKIFEIYPCKLWPDLENVNPQIAIVGIAGKSTVKKAKQNGLEVFSVKSSLRKTLDELHQKYPTVINLIILSHMNNAEDLEIKQWLDDNWKGYVYILGGHDHNKILHYDKSNPRSIILKGQCNGRTLQVIGINYTQSYDQLNNSTTNPIQSLAGHVYIMNASELANFTPSSQIQSIVRKWEQLLDKETNESKSDKIIKQFEDNVILDATELELRKGSTNFGNFVTDCVLKYTDSDIVFINSGHFRGDRKIGNILKLSDLKRIFVLSTKNKIIKTKMTCAECKVFLNHAYSEEGRGKILQVSKDTIKLLTNSKNDDEEFSVTMLYDMFGEDDDGFADILFELRGVTVDSLLESLRKDILKNCDLLDIMLHSSSHVKYDPSIRLSVRNFSEKKL